MIESQISYVLDAMRTSLRRGMATVDVRPDVLEAYNSRLQRRMQNTVWITGGCASWYIDSKGRNSALWPGLTWPFRRRTARFDPAAYTFYTSMKPGDSGTFIDLDFVNGTLKTWSEAEHTMPPKEGPGMGFSVGGVGGQPGGGGTRY